MSKQGYVASSDFALVNAGLGQVDQAICWLERACEERDSHLAFLTSDPRLASLHADHIVRLVLRGAFGLTLFGLSIGLPLTFAAGRFLGSQLYGMNPYDPLPPLQAAAAL